MLQRQIEVVEVMQGYMQVLLSLDMEPSAEVDSKMQLTMISGSTLLCFRCVWNCITDRLVGLVVRRPPREQKIPGSIPTWDGIFSGSSHTISDYHSFVWQFEFPWMNLTNYRNKWIVIKNDPVTVKHMKWIFTDVGKVMMAFILATDFDFIAYMSKMAFCLEAFFTPMVFLEYDNNIQKGVHSVVFSLCVKLVTLYH